MSRERETGAIGGEARNQFRERVVQAAEAALERHGSVGPLEMLQQMRLLEPVHFEHIRHTHTNYDTLLMQGVGRLEARSQVRKDIDRVATQWSAGGTTGDS